MEIQLISSSCLAFFPPISFSPSSSLTFNPNWIHVMSLLLCVLSPHLSRNGDINQVQLNQFRAACRTWFHHSSEMRQPTKTNKRTRDRRAENSSYFYSICAPDIPLFLLSNYNLSINIYFFPFPFISAPWSAWFVRNDINSLIPQTLIHSHFIVCRPIAMY